MFKKVVLHTDPMGEEKREIRDLGRTGTYFKPKVIKGGRFDGKVWKKLEMPLNKREMGELIGLHNKYIEILQKNGIHFIDTKVGIHFDGKTYRLSFLQDELPETELLSWHFQNSPTEKIVDMYSKMLKLCLNSYNGTGVKAYIGPNLENFGIRDGQIYFFDAFPFWLTNNGRALGTKYYTRANLFKEGRKKVFRKLAYPLRLRIDEWNNSRRNKPEKVLFRALQRAIRHRMDLKDELTEATKNAATYQFGDKTGSTVFARVLKLLSKHK
jgi:hypothetical protein